MISFIILYNKLCKLCYDGIFEIVVVPTVQPTLKTGGAAKLIKDILV